MNILIHTRMLQNQQQSNIGSSSKSATIGEWIENSENDVYTNPSELGVQDSTYKVTWGVSTVHARSNGASGQNIQGQLGG